MSVTAIMFGENVFWIIKMQNWLDFIKKKKAEFMLQEDIEFFVKFIPSVKLLRYNGVIDKSE